jgi:hypothetical protein
LEEDVGPQNTVIAFLSRPEAYGESGPVERIDTHISVIFLAGDRVYKMKRAVRFDYVDYHALDRRERFCREEVRRNRRTAPNLYLGVVPVTADADGALALNGGGEPVEWLVEMRRFDQADLFDRLVVGGRLDAPVMTRLADRIHAFHKDANIIRDVAGADAIRAVIDGNLAALRGPAAEPHDPVLVEVLAARAREALQKIAPLLNERGAAGAVRSCHGDLHLRNICLLDGEPTLFDGVEFNDAISSIDVLYDLAFLLMDLEHRGHRDWANVVFNRYLVMSGADAYVGVAAMPLFLSCRAAIRAHTTVAAAKAQGDVTAAAALRDEARAYLDLALRFLEPVPPGLVAIGGLSGTGKSSVAAGLAPGLGRAPGAVLLRSDVTRKRLFGIDPEEPLTGDDAYSGETTRKVYDGVKAVAGAALSAGYCVIADAVYARPAERTAIEAAAGEAAFQGLWLSAPTEVLQARVAARSGDASDADAAVVNQQSAYDPGPLTWTEIDASRDLETTLNAARAVIEISGVGSIDER